MEIQEGEDVGHFDQISATSSFENEKVVDSQKWPSMVRIDQFQDVAIRPSNMVHII